jgi:hypothetical protein
MRLFAVILITGSLFAQQPQSPQALKDAINKNRSGLVVQTPTPQVAGSIAVPITAQMSAVLENFRLRSNDGSADHSAQLTQAFAPAKESDGKTSIRFAAQWIRPNASPVPVLQNSAETITIQLTAEVWTMIEGARLNAYSTTPIVRSDGTQMFVLRWANNTKEDLFLASLKAPNGLFAQICLQFPTPQMTAVIGWPNSDEAKAAIAAAIK